MLRDKTASLADGSRVGGGPLAGPSRETSMRRIISAVPLLLCLALPASAQDQTQPADAPEVVTPMPPDDPSPAPATPESAPAPAAQTAPAPVAESVPLQDNVPSRHVVVKGDTLWDISARFLKN